MTPAGWAMLLPEVIVLKCATNFGHVRDTVYGSHLTTEYGDLKLDEFLIGEYRKPREVRMK